MLSLKEYIRLAEILVKIERSDFQHDEDAISAVVETMAKADKDYKFGSRDIYRYKCGCFGLRKYIGKNFKCRHIPTRNRRVEIMNTPQIEGINLDTILTKSSCHNSLICKEIKEFIETLDSPLKDILIEYYFLGTKEKEILKSFKLSKEILDQILKEGINIVRSKFELDVSTI